jgi:hypothetical protein
VGKAKLVVVKNRQTSISSYIIGCDKFQPNDRYHRYIKVDPSTIDIALLRDLFNGNAIVVRIRILIVTLLIIILNFNYY